MVLPPKEVRDYAALSLLYPPPSMPDHLRPNRTEPNFQGVEEGGLSNERENTTQGEERLCSILFV